MWPCLDCHAVSLTPLASAAPGVLPHGCSSSRPVAGSVLGVEAWVASPEPAVGVFTPAGSIGAPWWPRLPEPSRRWGTRAGGNGDSDSDSQRLASAGGSTAQRLH